MLKKITGFADKYDMLPRGGTILACVSGGADSMCLLTALLELAPQRDLTVIAAHYNHMLRGDESDRDARFVRDFCEARGVLLVSGSGDVAKLAREYGTGIEDAARRARYSFFDKAALRTGALRIVTAHTADDNIETVIMNLVRGAGAAGLAGIPPVRGGLTNSAVVRPMLTVTREEVLAFLTGRGVPYVEDSTNASDIYKRNRVRSAVVPLLRELNPRIAEAVTSASSLLRSDEDYLSGLAREFIDVHARSGTVNADKLLALHPAVSGRVIRLLGGAALSSGHAEAVLELCRKSGFHRLSLPDVTVFKEFGEITFGGEDHGKFDPFEIKDGETVFIRGAKLKITCNITTFDDKINKSLTTFHFKQADICGKIVVRPRAAGDSIRLAGRNGTKSIKKLFIEGRIPASRRGLIPIIADERGVLAVYGFGASPRAAPAPGQTALEIKFEGAPDND